MTDDQRRDRDVHAWILGEGAVRAPDRLRESVRAELIDTRQERATASLPEWLASMPMRAAAAVVVLAVGAAALGVIAGRGSVGLTSPTPTPTQSPTSAPSLSPTASPPETPAPTPPGTVLAAGAFTTSSFRPAVTLMVPAGWTAMEDGPDVVRFASPGARSFTQPDGITAFDGINLYARPRAGQPDGALTPVEGVGGSAKDLATWLSKRSQLIATTPIPDTIAGRAAYRLDFKLSAEAGDLCGIPCTNFLFASDNPDDYALGIEASWQVRAWLLDAPDGSTVVVTIEVPSGIAFDAVVAEATPVVRSMRFLAP
jgi:hypothetical protein